MRERVNTINKIARTRSEIELSNACMPECIGGQMNHNENEIGIIEMGSSHFLFICIRGLGLVGRTIKIVPSIDATHVTYILFIPGSAFFYLSRLQHSESSHHCSENVKTSELTIVLNHTQYY